MQKNENPKEIRFWASKKLKNQMFPKWGECFAPHLSLLVKDKCPKFSVNCKFIEQSQCSGIFHVFQVEVALFRNTFTSENGKPKCQDYVERVVFKNLFFQKHNVLNKLIHKLLTFILKVPQTYSNRKKWCTYVERDTIYRDEMQKMKNKTKSDIVL